MDNVLIGLDGQAKISDFGVSAFIGSEKVVRGSKRHYSPEAITRETDLYYTEKADVYMYGCFLYEYTHRQVFFGDISDVSEVNKVVLQGKRPPIDMNCNKQMAQLIVDCWNQSENSRPSFSRIKDQLGKMVVTEI